MPDYVIWGRDAGDEWAEWGEYPCPGMDAAQALRELHELRKCRPDREYMLLLVGDPVPGETQ